MSWRRFATEGEGLPYGIISPWGSSAKGFLSGAEGLPFGIFPPGEVLLCDFFRGKVCHMVFLHGKCLPYGILSGGTICHGICYLIMKFVWGEYLPLRGKLYHMVLFPPWGSFAMGFLPGEGFPYGINSGGTFAIWYNFRGGGGGGFRG